MKKFILISAISFTLSLFSQAQYIDIDTTNANTPYVTQFGSSLSLNIGARSFDSLNAPDDYIGPLMFKYITDTMIAASLQPADIDTVQVDMNANNSFMDTFSINIPVNNSNNFQVGGNIIIVWPTTVDNTPVDSIIIDVIVEDTLLLILPHITNYIVYPNPAAQQVTVLSTEMGIHAIMLFDTEGRMLSSLPNLGGTSQADVDISAYPQGMYLLRVSFDGGEQRTLTIIRQ